MPDEVPVENDPRLSRPSIGQLNKWTGERLPKFDKDQRARDAAKRIARDDVSEHRDRILEED